MLANLDRDNFIELLNKLGEEKDEDVLSAARDLHAQLTVAEISWDDLLVPDQVEEPEEEGEDEDDLVGDDYSDLEDDSEDEADADEDEDEDEEGDGEEDGGFFDDEGEKPLSDEDKKEALALIDKLGAMDVSKATREELKEYKQDIDDGDFAQMDLRYLRAFHQRLSK